MYAGPTMALTIAQAADTIRPYHIMGDLKAVPRKVTFDSSYPTGGEAISPSDFGLGRIVWVQVNAVTDVATKEVQWVDAAGAHKLKIMVEDSISGIAAEAANASDQSAVSVHVLVYGF